MFSIIYSAALHGFKAARIEVQAHVAAGFPSFTVVGLPDTAVQESKERIRSAIKQSGFRFPEGRITVNLAPANLRKIGPSFDLPIAIAILIASKQCREKIIPWCVFGELALDGSTRPVTGILSIISALKSQNNAICLLSQANAREAALVQNCKVIAVTSLLQAVQYLEQKIEIESQATEKIITNEEQTVIDFSDIKGHKIMKRVLEIAAAGQHHILMYGSPGIGKTLLAKSLVSILPSATIAQLLETSRIHSMAGLISADKPYINQRPFRQPHHSASVAAIIGGGQIIKPGEISLAHNGVLFLDEFTEFPRNVIEALRQPLEQHTITIARAEQIVTYPAASVLVASCNPCPCGYLGDVTKACNCTPLQIQKYIKKISGPILDRIDLIQQVVRVSAEELQNEAPEETSVRVRSRVIQAWQIQQTRFANTKIQANAYIPHQQLKHYCNLDIESLKLLKQALQVMNLSPRCYHSIIRIARTIADLAGVANINTAHLSEALQYRRSPWLLTNN